MIGFTTFTVFTTKTVKILTIGVIFTKVKEIDFSSYDYKRINLIGPNCNIYFSDNAEDAIVNTYGEYELYAENGVVQNENGWLVLTTGDNIN